MKIITIDQLKNRNNRIAEGDTLFDSTINAFILKYLETNTSSDFGQALKLGFSPLSLKSHLKYVYRVTGDSIQGKTFLDLGCGSTSYDHSFGFDNYMNQTRGKDRTFEPWLCRFLHELGARVVGIDVGNLAGEKFEHYSLDLLAENALACIPDHSVDYVHSKLLYSSPQLGNMVRKSHFPQIAEEVKDQSRPYWNVGDQEQLAERVLKQRLLPQIERVLKLDGIYLCFE